jgi:polyisoprenyl-teichoic acid--peptidoglycan teichoic acid transferase
MVMLVRLDPTQSQIRVLSLPVSLTARFARFGTMTIAQAHATDGPKGVLQIVKEVTDLRVNHLVDVDTRGFARIVDQLGCVYVDVDRPYPLGTATVNAPDGLLRAGYQRLCGATALQYALFAGDGSESRQEERQQRLLAAMAPRGSIWPDRAKLVKLFTRYAESDVTGVHAVLRVIGLLIPLQRAPVTTIPFTAGGESRSAGAAPPGLDQAMRRFLALPPKSAQIEARVPGRSRIRQIRLERPIARALGQVSGVPRLDPTAIPEGWSLARPRVYRLDGIGEGSPPAGERSSYRWTFRGPVAGEYAGFQATAWRNPPMLNNPSAEMTKHGRTYKLFYDGGSLRTVAWQTPNGSFWVSNTLTDTLSNRQMIALANGMIEAGGERD